MEARRGSFGLFCTPLFLPLAMQMGTGPVQFGTVQFIGYAIE